MHFFTSVSARSGPQVGHFMTRDEMKQLMMASAAMGAQHFSEMQPPMPAGTLFSY
jgi:hypothetical protein